MSSDDRIGTSPTNTSQRKSNWMFWLVVAWLFFILVNPRFNPANYYLEASPADYFRAYRLVTDGGPADAEMVRALIEDGRLTVSDIDPIWKAYVKLPDIAGPLDDGLTVEQGRMRLMSAIRTGE